MSVAHLLSSTLGPASSVPTAHSRAEEEDGDALGTGMDVAKRKGDIKEKLDEKKKEQEISVNIDTVDSSDDESDADDEDRSRKKDKPPKKWSYKDHDKLKKSPLSPTSPPSVMFNVGDLVWGRTMGSSYHPCVVSQDPHFRFHTKIVKAEPGIGLESPPPPGREGVGERQYHVQYLGDNKRVWLPSKQIIPYKGIAHYEQMAIQDVKNINKIYKPKTEALKTAWREAVLLAQQLEQLTSQERISRCDMARLRERGGKALQKKMEFESKRRSSESDDSTKGRRSSESSDMKSPERFKSPTSPRKPMEKEGEERKKSAQYRRREEMEYKMHKGSGQEKRKRKSSDDEKKTESPKSLPLNVLDVATPTFNRSFKMKGKAKDAKIDVIQDGFEGIKVVNNTSADEGEKTPLEWGFGSHGNGKSKDVSNGGSGGGDGMREEEEGHEGQGGGENGKSNLISGSELNSEDLVEGSLVWAKIKGYSYWPSVVTRDPADGEFVKVPDSQFKTQRKCHVLFLEYNNQRAWLPSTSLKEYKGRQEFQAEAAKAGPNRKKDFIPGKRYQAPFEKAVTFSESLVTLTNEERLEVVLLKYGWVMVSEPGSGEERGVQKQKKRKTVRDTEVEVNKSTDSETDYQANMASPAMTRPSSADRRSSAEAESRLDPGVDSLEGDTSNTTQRVGSVSKKKRESSLIAAIALNGDSSSDDSGDDSGGESKSKKVKKRPQVPPVEKVPPVKAKPKASPIPRAKVQTVSTPGSPMATTTTQQPPPPKTGEPDEFPKIGDLVWGRMSGFPFWPCFVTKSPTGQYRREGPSGKASYHVQFFNWNDESGWVNAVIEFDGLDSFKKIAAKKKTDKSYNPSKGAMMNKWEKAAREAEETMGLTRLERFEQYLVLYGANNPKPPKPSPVRTPKPAPTPKPKKVPVPAAAAVPPPVKRTPGPASKTGVKRSPQAEAGGQLPAGWRIRNRTEGGQTFISPDGREFQDKTAALRYIASSVGQSQAVKYLEDGSLPSGWRCQRIQTSIYFFSPRGERFETRDAVADRLEEEGASLEVVARVRRGGKKKLVGPKSVMRRLGIECASDDSARESSTSEDEDPETILRLPNGLKYRRGGQMDEFLDLDKLFDPSNGGIIEMVQLPDIFLEHPTVSVTESDNEMVISDVDTGEFIAKKIIYD